MISVASKTDMKEQIELKIDMGDSDLDTDIPNVEFMIDDGIDVEVKPAASLVPAR
jgi:hypothetical protein